MGFGVDLYLNIVIVWREALGLLGCHVDVRADQSAKETLQLLLDSPQLILTKQSLRFQYGLDFLIHQYLTMNQHVPNTIALDILTFTLKDPHPRSSP